MDCDRFSIELNIYGYLKDQAITFHQISLLATAVPALDKSQETGGNGQLPVTVLV